MDKPVTEQPYIKSLEEKTVPNKKGVIVFGVSIFSACLFAGCAHFFFQHPFIPILQLISFLLMGSIYSVFMQKKLLGEKEAFSHALFLSIALIVSLSAFYFFKKAFHFMDVFSMAAAFLLPNLIMEAWRLYNSISFQYRPVWSYSKEIPPEPVFIYLENKPLRVQLLIDDNKPAVISSAAPRTLPLGMAIFYILKKEVEINSGDWRKLFIKENGQPYNWLFYNKSYGIVKTYFRPEENLSENKIKSNTLIVAKRVE